MGLPISNAPFHPGGLDYLFNVKGLFYPKCKLSTGCIDGVIGPEKRDHFTLKYDYFGRFSNCHHSWLSVSQIQRWKLRYHRLPYSVKLWGDF